MQTAQNKPSLKDFKGGDEIARHHFKHLDGQYRCPVIPKRWWLHTICWKDDQGNNHSRQEEHESPQGWSSRETCDGFNGADARVEERGCVFRKICPSYQKNVHNISNEEHAVLVLAFGERKAEQEAKWDKIASDFGKKPFRVKGFDD